MGFESDVCSFATCKGAPYRRQHLLPARVGPLAFYVLFTPPVLGSGDPFFVRMVECLFFLCFSLGDISWSCTVSRYPSLREVFSFFPHPNGHSAFFLYLHCPAINSHVLSGVPLAGSCPLWSLQDTSCFVGVTLGVVLSPTDRDISPLLTSVPINSAVNPI